MREPWRARVVGRVLVTALALGCDALPGRDEPTKQVAAEPVRAAEPAEAARPERGADMPVLRRPVEPGYLAPPDRAGTQPVTPTPTPTATPIEEARGEPPRWEKLLNESRELAAAGRWENIGPARAKELEAIRAIRELPEDDPRYVEAQCVLAERAHVGADHEAALLGAIARLRAHPPANFDRYAHLDRDDLITTTIGAAFTDDGKILLNPSNGLTSAGDCSKPDLALLITLLIDGYHSYGMFRRAYPDVTPPAVEDPFKAASQALLDLHAELIKEYGAKHARPAALVERYYFACHWSHRKRHPKICYTEKDERKVYEQALVAREATYGEDHPLTRASLLRVGVELLNNDKREEALALLKRAMAGEIDDESKATAAAIVATMAMQAGRVDEGLAIFGRVEAAGPAAFGEDDWSYGGVLQLHASALRASRRFPEALRVFKKYLATQGAGAPGSRQLPWPGYAELLVAAGERDEALAEYERRIAYAVELERTGANAPARQEGRDQTLKDLRARADLRRAVGDAAGAEADLAEARRIEAGPPVPPDP